MSLNKLVLFVFLVGAAAACSLGQTLSLIPAGAEWRFLDDGSDQGSVWREATFDDGGWRTGRAQLGYGDGDEVTVVGFGPDANDKYPTTYFRRAFTIEETNLTAVTNLILQVLRDDGVIVYLNGREVFRNSMPLGAVHFRTYASATTEGTGFLLTNLPPGNLTAGVNVMAAEIHQSTPDSSDISFNLDLAAQLVRGQPQFRSQPQSLAAFAGQNVTFSANAVGVGPLLYQWFRDNAPIPQATNVVLSLANVSTNDVGGYHVVVSNAEGSTMSAVATLTVTQTTGDVFQVRSLGTNGLRVVNNSAISDDRGGIAASSTHLLVNGDNGAAVLEIDTLTGANSGTVYDALVSNLRTEKFYTFANGTNPVTAGTITADSLIELDNAGRLTANSITLSTAVNLGFSPGFFSGFNRAVLLNGAEAINIALPSGQVSSLGPMNPPPHVISEGWGFWGVAEYFDDTVHVVYVAGGGSILRTVVPTGESETVAAFENLGDMSMLTVSLTRQRWYFHFEGTSQFGSFPEATGYADASFSYESLPRPPTIVTEPRNQFVPVGGTFSLAVTTRGTEPFTYQWFLNDEPVPHGTNATLTVEGATETDSGMYFVLVENAAGAASSTPATITVGELATEIADDFEPEVDPSMWLRFSSVAGITNHPGGSVSGSNSLWFAGADERMAVARPMDLSAGALISFQLRLADGGSFPWEQADVPGEGVAVEYSLDDSNWVEMARFDDPRFYSWRAVLIEVPEEAQTAPVLLRWRQLSHSGFENDHWALDDVRVRRLSGPPEILSQPSSVSVFSGSTAEFYVGAVGAQPLRYQWFFNEVALPGATNSSLSISNASTTNAGLYFVAIANPEGSVTSSNVTLEVVEIGGGEFKILELLASGSRIVNHASLTGDDRGGIAVSSNRVFYTGDSSTARFNLHDLGGGARLNRVYDGLVSNLRTETVYTLANGVTPLSNNGGTVDGLMEIDSNSGALTPRTIRLSTPITLPGGAVGLFSGYDRVVIHTGERVLHIGLPSGQVVDLGLMSSLPAQSCENWAYWGVAEFFDGTLYLAYVGFQQIQRARVPDGLVETIATFQNLSDMCSFTVSLAEERWYFHHEGTSQFGGSDEVVGFADAAFMSPLPPRPVEITSQPQNQSVLEGGQAEFSVGIRGTRPIQYQWRLNGVAVPNATNATLIISNVSSADVGSYSVQVSNVLATVVSSEASLTIEPVTADTFQVAGLFRTGARVRNHAEVTGDDRGGIAVSSNQVFYSGDSATARFGLDDLGGGTRVGRVFDALVSNLRTEQVYTLGNGATPLGSSGGTVTTLIELNGNTGGVTANRISLSQPISLPSFGVGIFAGWDRIALHTGSRVFQIRLPSGQVQDMGAMAGPLHQDCENWAYWGVAEFFAGSLHLLCVRDFESITRTRVPTGQVTEVARFNGLGDMCSMSVSPYRGRWYFHYEGGAEFGGFDEMIGYADARFIFGAIAPRIVGQPRSRTSITGASASFNVNVAGGVAPLSYQWRHNGEPLVGETNATLRLRNLHVSQAGEYTVVITNSMGSVTSQVASLILRPLQGNSFRITALTATGSNVVDTLQFSGGHRSSLALSSFRLFEDSFGGLGSWSADDLSGGRLHNANEDGLVSDLHSETVYALGNGTNRVGIDQTITTLLELDPDSGEITGRVISLSQPIETSGDMGFFSGFDRVVIYNGTNVYNIDLPLGEVTDLGLMTLPPRVRCQNWGMWGVAEYFNRAIHLVYRGNDNRTIVRTRVPDGTTTTVTAFSELGDMCALTFSPARNRWYFTFNFSQFGFAPAVGYASAGWDQPNTQPVIALPQRRFEIPEDSVLRDLPLTVFDAETRPDALVLAIDSSNPALIPSSHVEGSDTGTNRLLQITPVADANGVATITLSVTDAHGVTATNSLEVTVRPVNDAPAFVKGADISLPEDSGPLVLSHWATAISPGPADEASQRVIFTVDTDNPGLFASGPGIASDGTLSLEPAPNANGMATLAVRAQDDGGTADGGRDTSEVQFVRVVVVPVNDPPGFVKGADVAVNEDAALQTLPGWATGIVAGPPNEAAQSLSFNVTTDAPGLFETPPAVSPDGTLSFKPAAEAHGVANVSIMLSDNGGTAHGGVDASAPQSFQIAVQAVNDPPSFTRGSDVSVLEDAGPQSVPGWASGIRAGPANESAQAMFFTVTTDAPELFEAGPAISAAGELSFTPKANSSGAANVSVQLKDDGGAANGGSDTSGPQSFVISIEPVNDAPAFTKGPDVMVMEDAGPQELTHWASGISPGPGEETQTLAFVVTVGNAGLFEVLPAIDGEGTLSFTPRADAHGAAEVEVVLRDDGGTAHGGIDTTAPQTFSITILPVNDAPVAHGQSVVVSEDDSVAITLGGSDADGDPLTYTVLTASAHGALSGTAPALTYRPEPDYSGPDSFTFTVSDGNTSSAPATVSITVRPANDPPVAVMDVSSPTMLETNGTEYIVLATNQAGAIVVLDASRSSDMDADPLTFYWFVQGATEPFDSGVRVTNLFAVGSHVIELAAVDREAFGRATATIHVITPSQALSGLIALVQNSQIHRAKKRPLITQLKSAAADFTAGRICKGLKTLESFQKKVRTQLLRSEPEIAGVLLAAAQEILDPYAGYRCERRGDDDDDEGGGGDDDD